MQNHQVHTTYRKIHRISPANAEVEVSSIPEIRKETPKELQKSKKMYPTAVKTLAEAVILQAVEDLWSKTHRQKSIEFFTGQGFKDYADMAGMSSIERMKLIQMVGGNK